MTNSCGSCKNFVKGGRYSLCDLRDVRVKTDSAECKLYKRIKLHRKVEDADLRTTNKSS